jgi:hypothetical protein
MKVPLRIDGVVDGAGQKQHAEEAHAREGEDKSQNREPAPEQNAGKDRDERDQKVRRGD